MIALTHIQDASSGSGRWPYREGAASVLPCVILLSWCGDGHAPAFWIAAGRLLLVAMLLLMLPSCASRQPAPVYGWDWQGPVPEGFYLVRSGDSLSVVGARLGIAMSKLAKWNRLKSPYRIYAGTLLRVQPGRGSPPRSARRAARVVADRPAKADLVRPLRNKRQPLLPSGNAKDVKAQQSLSAPAAQSTVSARPVTSARAPVVAEASRDGLAWNWPLQGRVVRSFRQNETERSGIRVAGQAGEPIYAAAAGEVIYSAAGLPSYGKLVIVRHNDKYLSAYGFARRLLVSEGDQVERGQPLAEVGRGPDGAHVLHFEIRRNGTGVDPLRYLPPRS